MSLASIVGGVIAYPINYWLVSRHLKHGCMTLPGADGPAAGLGHRSPEESKVMADEFGMRDMSGSGGHHEMTMTTLSTPAAVAWIVVSFIFLFAALWATNVFVPIRFS